MTIYDDKGRPIQVKSTNITGGADIVTTQYGWQGLPLIIVVQTHRNASQTETITIVTKNDYDTLGRIEKIEKRQALNSGAMSDYATISQMKYDALGQLNTKELGTAPLETLAYDYNIRGWLLGANREYISQPGTPADKHFGFDLGYDKNGVLDTYTPRYNGNISGTIWKSAGDGEKRKYDFSYDAVNRLLKADFTQYTGSAFNTTAGVDFSVKLGDGSSPATAYDANGNIKAMTQIGLKLNSSSQIDSLAYTYQTNSNKLSKVTDAANDKDSKLGDFKYDPATKGSTDYSYDDNGNLISDANKKISSITYNYLNLPSVITVSGKGTITYTYDAAGDKLRKVVVDNTASPSKTTTTLYIGGAVYQNDTLQFISHEEGRIRFLPSGGGFAYDYFLKDHLGNVRMVLTGQKDTAFYPAVTFEDANIATEQLYYDNVDVQRTSRPGAFFSSTSNGSKVQLLRKSVQSKGAGELLKVMAGDRLHIKVDYYIPTAATNNNTANGLNTILNAIASIIDNNPATGALHGSGSTITTDLDNSTPFTDFLAPQTGTPGTTLPKAYLNIIFFDEQFKFVSTNSEAVQVTSEGSGQTIYRVQGNAKEAAKNGYVYIYVSNESDNFVYFDNLQITHERGSVLEETHYYPFGLTMAGISSKALNGVIKNKYGITGKEIQNKEFSDGSGLELYDFGARMQDPQIGRWNTVDPLVSNYYWLSPYNYCNDNPIKYLDPNGMEFRDTVINGNATRIDIETLEGVYVTGRQKEGSGADFAFPWVAGAVSSSARRGLQQRDVYMAARRDGWTEQQMSESWRSRGVSPSDLASYENSWQADKDYRNMQLVAVGIIGAPILASVSPNAFVGSLGMRSGSALADGLIQYFENVGNGNGFGMQNISMINLTSPLANFVLPGSALGSSIVGNGLNFSLSGWQGISATNSGANMLINMILGYGGNAIGSGLSNASSSYLKMNNFQSSFYGNLFGDYIGYGGQFINKFSIH